MSCNTICIDRWISARKLANITQLALPSCPPSLPHLIFSLKNESVSGRRPLKQQFQKQQNCNSFCICEYVNLYVFAILLQTACNFQLDPVQLQHDNSLTPSFCCFITELTHQNCYEDSNSLRVVADLVPIFEATMSKATTSQVHLTQLQ